jgi:hypothetical protein
MAHSRTEQASFHQVPGAEAAEDASQGPTTPVKGNGASNPKLMVAPHRMEEDVGQSTLGARLTMELYKLRATVPRREFPEHSDSWTSSASIDGTITMPFVGSAAISIIALHYCGDCIPVRYMMISVTTTFPDRSS